ncbi:hypothetical protein [Salegentibacter sp.]|uniref:hypothetical protein n=1 Tax=Salegentibacter sp. TaxID=1903072 RepID=UPI0035694F54
MERDKVERLLKKYLAGETTRAEEKSLKNYFLKNKVPAHLEKYRSRFSFQDQNRKSIQSRVSGKKFYVWSGVAAIIILALVGVFLLKGEFSSNDNSALGTIHDEEIALEKTQETLKMVSEIMNERKKDLGYLKEFNKTRERIIKHE